MKAALKKTNEEELETLKAQLGQRNNQQLEVLKADLKQRTDGQIETLKGDIQQNNETLSSLSSAYLTNFNKVQEKRIEAAAALWSAVLGVKGTVPSVVYMAYAILTDEELSYEQVCANNGMRNLLTATNQSDQFNKLDEIRKEIEHLKPFISDKADMLFSALHRFTGRISHKFLDGYKNKKITPWKEDIATKNMLQQVLSDREIYAVYGVKVGSFERAQFLLETKILAEIRESLYGKNLTRDTVEHLNLMQSSYRNPDQAG